MTIAMLIALPCLIGCGSIERSYQSGYAGRSATKPDITVTALDERAEYEQLAAQRELGPNSDPKAIQYRQLLKQRERNIEGRSEREQYYNAKPYLRNDLERLQFLELPTTASRAKYLQKRGINGTEISHPKLIQDLIHQNDIAAGMTKQAVRESWGPPDEIDVAGERLYGNEKWHYTEQVTTGEGYMTERRTVIFEGGRVVGWETR
jgi:hypothetical protein